MSDQQMQILYAPLSEIATWAWEDNSKLHQPELIAHSIRTHGFKDPVGVGTWEENGVMKQMLVEGHGRTETLLLMRAKGEPAPKDIVVDGEEEEGKPRWLVPYVISVFPDKNHAILYALAHNRSQTAKILPEDYNVGKLRGTLGKLGMQELPGFGEQDLIGGAGVGTQTTFGLPTLPAFDVSKLPDAPEQVVNTPQSYVMMITFPSYEEFKECLRVLSLNQRTSLPDYARMASIDGVAYLNRWRELLLGQLNVEIKPAREEKLPDPISVEDLLNEKQMEQATEQFGWDSPDALIKEEPTATKKGNKKEKPMFVGGLCARCGGSGGNCEQCLGTGTEEAYKAQLAEVERG